MKHIYKLFLLCVVSLLIFLPANGQQKLDPADYFTQDNFPNTPTSASDADSSSTNTAEYKEIGPWYTGASTSGWGGGYRQTSRLGGYQIAGRSATWTINVPPGKAGSYVVYNYVLQAANNASNVFYTVQREFETNILDSVRHDLRRSTTTLASVGIGVWVPLMIVPLNVGNVFITVGADSASGSAIMRADAVRILKSSQIGPDLEFGRRERDGFDSVRVGESWLDAPLGVITYTEIPLFNLGTQDLIVTSVYAKTLPNRWDVKLQDNGTFPLTIKPGEKKKIAIGFRPFEEETVADTLVIESNDAAEPTATIPIDGNGINYNFIMNASVTNEPHYNAPFDVLGDPRRPEIIYTGNWASSGTGLSRFPFPIAGGNLFGTYTFDAVASVEYRFQLPDSLNGKPGSAGYYFIEHGAIPFTSNSENNAQVTIIPAFSVDTVRSSYNQSGLSTPPFFYALANKPILLNQGDFTSVTIYRTIATNAVLRADLLRIRKIPTGATIAAAPEVDFGNVSVYEEDRQKAGNYFKKYEINSGGESKLVIDSIILANPKYYSIQENLVFPIELAAVNGTTSFTIQFKPDTIATGTTGNGLNTTIRIYSSDSTKSPYTVALRGNGVGTGLIIEESDASGAYIFPPSPVSFPDYTNMGKWQQLQTGSGGNSLVGFIYYLEGDQSVPKKNAYVEYFPEVPTLSGHGPEIDTFNVYVQMAAGSSNSSPAAKYTIFPAAGGTPLEVVVNQNNRGSRVFLGAAQFLRADSRDAHGGGAITGFIRLENDTALVSEYYKDSLVNRAKQDTFVLRADAIILQETLTGVEYVIHPNVPTSFDMSQNYPNPFNPTTQIRFGLPTSQNVSLSIYDVLGREVRSLVNGYHEAGSYTITWDGNNNSGSRVASGMYIYRIQAGNFVSTKKMLLMK